MDPEAKQVAQPPSWLARVIDSPTVRVIIVLVGLFAIVNPIRNWRGCRTQMKEWYADLAGEFPPAQQGELLVLVARFHCPPGVLDAEPHEEIARALRAAGQSQAFHNRFRVETLFKEVPVDAIALARALGKRYSASLVIWGADTGVRVTVNFFDLLNDRPTPQTITTTDNVITYNPRGYTQYITKSLPAELTSLAFSAISGLRYAEGAYTDAITLAQEAIRSFPTDTAKPQFFTYPLVAALTQRGRDSYLNRDYRQALVDFDSALRFTDPSWPAGMSNAHNGRGLAEAALGQLDVALEDLNQAIALQPNAAPPYRSRGWVHEKSGRFDLARADFDKAVLLDPDATEARLLRGSFLKAQGGLDDALKDCEFVLKREPENGPAHQCRGDVLAGSGNTQGAAAEWQMAKAACGAFCDHVKRGAKLMREGNPREALEEFDRAIKVEANNWLGYSERGFALLTLNRVAEARIAFVRAIELQPRVHAPHHGLGLALYEQREYDEAIEAFTTALAIGPSEPNVLESRALAYEVRGRTDLAKADREHAERLRIGQ